MPSQEDYLDQLLKGITENEPEETNLADTSDLTSTESFETSGDFNLTEEAPVKVSAKMPSEEVEEDFGMSEEEIEQLLQETRMEGTQEKQAKETNGEDDLMQLLEGADDGDLQDIHDMLQKSDNNEAVDEDLIALLQDIPDEVNAEDYDDSPKENDGLENGELTKKQKRALEKKRQKEEKAAAKQAEKEAKQAAKEAKKAAKGKGKAVEEAAQEPANASAEEQPVEADMSALDELLGLDGQAPASADSVENAFEKEVDAQKGDTAKKGFFAKILDFLTEEEEEEEPVRGTEDIPLSDENRVILEELDQEESAKKGKKAKKSKKAKKDKKAKNSQNVDEEGDEAEDEEKPKKAAKPKKEKKPKEQSTESPANKISVKKVMPIAVLGISVLLAILILVNLGGDFTVKQVARKAFYQEDYETCYQELYGRNLNETEQVMFGKSESILHIRLWMREYELFVEEGAETEALDVLIQSVNDYAELYDYASQWNAETMVGEVYEQMLGILQGKYGLTESQALEIAAEPDDVEYTKKVLAVAEGNGYGSWDTTSSQTFEVLPDMLPPEEKFPENNGGQSK
jgi:hypothetical protein